ncbi:MAG: hypothetical protein JRI72_17540 [Deltaproteobacteria bacterium]|nr:hypothetical protein [Deltaproteobacteria bacterium]
MKKAFWIFTVLLGFFTFFVIYPLSSDARPIKVGIIDCYSGPAAVFGKDALNGFKLALKDINRVKRLSLPPEIPSSRLISPLIWPRNWS